jgi:MerR family transcriptional regulator, light-induced transcriptional regulator
MDSLTQQQPVCDDGPAGCADGPLGRLAADAANDTRMSQLVQTIEQEIIPRLLMAHRDRAPQSAPPSPSRLGIGIEDVHHFAKLALSDNDTLAIGQVNLFLSRGASIETIFVQLLAPTARYLGELWSEDLCSFADVTVGLCRLQRVLRELSPDFEAEGGAAGSGRRILLLPSPGEQHTFGLLMVAEFFRRERWDVSGGSWAQGSDAPALVAGDWYDVLGFSLGSEIHIKALAEIIREARRASRNRALAVLVGGPLFAQHPGYADEVGADGVTIDGSEAPALAERLIVRTASQ